MVFVKLDSRYADCFPEHSSYFGRALRLLKSIYGMTNSGKLFDDELTDWLIESCFIQYQWQISIYYKYAPDGANFVVPSYIDDCVYWYTSKSTGKLVCGHFRKYITCEIPGICNLFDVNPYFTDEGPLHSSISV